MNPLSSIYGAVTAVRNQLYDRSVLQAQTLRGPVVSVGNLSTGGSGKTPFVILLGEELRSRGVEFDVLSRGYRRSTSGVALVNPEGTASEFGDEPLLLARRLGAPVILGESRYEAGFFAEKKFGPRMHLLDDGFQHRALARDFDIVLVSSGDANDRLLPAGRLREPMASLTRADAIVLTNDAPVRQAPIASKQLWRVRRGIRLDKPPDRLVAFCGIARPHRFFADLRQAGISPITEVSFRDHHRYSPDDVQRLLELKTARHANGFVTTAKDAINLGKGKSALEPLCIAEVTMQFESPADAVDTMLRIISERKRWP